ncbi:sigma-54-dependent Fis family transcriptional regulator [bacterium]|nr:sigma-54-dependent Fis family transcriptional regulator [candidate division CSSED10-310 bacterium]
MSDNDKILIVDDSEQIRNVIADALSREGYEVSTAKDGETAVATIKDTGHAFNIVVTDLKMRTVSGLDLLDFVKRESPDTDVILITAFGTVETAVQALKRGAYDYMVKPLDFIHFRVVIKKLLEKQKLQQENIKLKQILQIKGDDELVVGTSQSIREVYEIVNRVADTDVTVLIEGESGTGKDVVARAIHNRSKRVSQPFIIINCGALPETLLENELFGHEKDAFTGASGVKKGRFELAHRGTLFLDEITEMGKNSQADFLRVLEDGIITRVGGVDPIKVDVRVVAASNRNLKQACENNTFREDLYYRLNVVSITMPRLRDRREDIPILAGAFLKEFAIKHNKGDLQIPEDTMQLLTNYPWPGNVRELRNTLERVVILGKRNEVSPKHFPPSIQVHCQSHNAVDIEVGMTLEEVERRVIMKTLDAVGGHRKRAAEILNISLRALQYKIKKFELGGKGGAAELEGA